MQMKYKIINMERGRLAPHLLLYKYRWDKWFTTFNSKPHNLSQNLIQIEHFWESGMGGKAAGRDADVVLI